MLATWSVCPKCAAFCMLDVSCTGEVRLQDSAPRRPAVVLGRQQAGALGVRLHAKQSPACQALAMCAPVNMGLMPMHKDKQVPGESAAPTHCGDPGKVPAHRCQAGALHHTGAQWQSWDIAPAGGGRRAAGRGPWACRRPMRPSQRSPAQAIKAASTCAGSAQLQQEEMLQRPQEEVVLLQVAEHNLRDLTTRILLEDAFVH